MANNFILSITPKKAKDIKIIGFSNSNNALLTYPKSNYIDQNAMKIGERAAELLIKRLQSTKKSESYSHIKIPPKFKF
jgi:LacI family transcriptional regulator